LLSCPTELEIKIKQVRARVAALDKIRFEAMVTSLDIAT
jgi:hypothetical protein